MRRIGRRRTVRVRAPRRFVVDEFDVQADGKLAVRFRKEFGRETRFGWVSRSGRFHRLRHRSVGKVFMVRDRIAFMTQRGDLRVTDLHGRLRRNVRPRRVSLFRPTELVDFDGRCLLSTRPVGTRDRVAIQVVRADRRPSPACR